MALKFNSVDAEDWNLNHPTWSQAFNQLHSHGGSGSSSNSLPSSSFEEVGCKRRRLISEYELVKENDVEMDFQFLPKQELKTEKDKVEKEQEKDQEKNSQQDSNKKNLRITFAKLQKILKELQQHLK